MTPLVPAEDEFVEKGLDMGSVLLPVDGLNV
jgi:hypothetical protein